MQLSTTTFRFIVKKKRLCASDNIGKYYRQVTKKQLRVEVKISRLKIKLQQTVNVATFTFRARLM